MPIWHLPQPLGLWNRCRPRRSRRSDRPRRGGAALAAQQDYPPVGRLALTGHAHIDLAWLWPVAETRRKGRRTFSTVLDLMERYDDFTFNQSSAQLYTWIEEDAPDLFERVKERVAEGRWEPIGGSWVEPDSQVTGGESLSASSSTGSAISRRSANARRSPGCRMSSASRAGFRSCCAAPGSTASSPPSSTGTREPLPLRPLHLGRDRRQPGDGQHVPQSRLPTATTGISPRSTCLARGASSTASATTRRACSPSAGVMAAGGHGAACSRTTRESRSSRRCRACAWRRSRSSSPPCRNRVCRSGWESSTWSSTAAR